MSDDPVTSQLINYLRSLGATTRAVEFSPAIMLRKDGITATPEKVDEVHAELATLEARGEVLLGEINDIGVMVLLCTPRDTPVVLSAERLVSLYGSMNVHEKNMLQRWEAIHLATSVTSTTDWPGWAVIYRRRHNRL
jgi:hypothetical protein